MTGGLMFSMIPALIERRLLVGAIADASKLGL